METPYRNQKMLESIISTCQNDTMLCIAVDITLPTETIKDNENLRMEERFTLTK